MKNITKRLAFFLLFCFTFMLYLAACTSKSKNSSEQILNKTWIEISEEAAQTEVTMMMWMGDPLINNYMNDVVKPTVKERYNIDLEVVDGQGTQIVSTLMGEIESGRQTSQIDMMWLNGETFYQLRQVDALFGPFTNKLPNSQFIDFENPFIGVDFQQPIDGYEAPWGNVQLSLIVNSEYISNPPKTRNELRSWVQDNPGRFTIPTEFTGMTFLKSLLIDIAGGKGSLSGEFDEDLYEEYSNELWDYLNDIKSNFWRNGNTFPNSIAQMHQLFANGELWFTMSNNDSEVDNKINQGLFPHTARAYVLETGTIQNSHYLGISSRSDDIAGAMAVINYMISPEAQHKKMDPEVWGDGTVLSIEKLPEEWQKKFQTIPNRINAPPRSELQPYALQELSPEYMIRIFEDFRTYVVNQ